MTGHPSSSAWPDRPRAEAAHLPADARVGRLQRILASQRDVYDRLGALSDAQSQAIEQDDAEALLGILGQRQALIEQLSALNKDLAPFEQAWDQLSAQLPDDQREHLRAQFAAVSRQVEEIQKRDEADFALLEQRRQAVQREMGSIHTARGAVAAYGSAGVDPSSPRYQDREG